MQIPCPSGFVFEARHWNLGDQRALLDVKEDADGNLPLKMVSLAAQQVINPGPYKMAVGSPVVWAEISHADIAVANIFIRAGRKPMYLLHPNCANCRKLLSNPVEIDLLDLKVYMASPEGIQHLATDAPIIKETCGATVKLQALRARHLGLMSRLQQEQEQDILEIQTCMHIREISSPQLKAPLVNLPEIREFWKVQDTDFRDEIETATDTLFGGIDQSFTFTCDRLACRTEQKHSVPLDLTFYGLDLDARQSRRAKASLAVSSVRELMQRVSEPSSSGTPTPSGSTSP